MARKPSARKNRRAVDYGDLNLVPIMSIITLLIPLLIYAFNFFEIKIVSVAAPRMGTGTSKKTTDEDQKKPLNLTVVISDKGFLLKMEPTLVETAEFRIEKRTFQNTQGEAYREFDFPRLYAKLVELKEKFPKESTVNLGAEFGVTWSVISRTIDATRTQLKEKAYDLLPEYGTAEAKLNKDKQPELLFPNVVFVVVD
jgi:biopolymer transport protein ExbD